MSLFSQFNQGYRPGQLFPPPSPQQGKFINQQGMGQFNFDFGSWKNDLFHQGGFFNQNTGIGGHGKDSFNMGGLFNFNRAAGGAGNDHFNVGGGIFNRNIADGGAGNDSFLASNNGYANDTSINGGSGYDTVKLQGSIFDYDMFTDDQGVRHFRHRESGNQFHLMNVEDIQFSKPAFNPFFMMGNQDFSPEHYPEIFGNRENPVSTYAGSFLA